MVWSTFLEKNFPRSSGHLLDFGGGLNPCQDGLGHLVSPIGGSPIGVSPSGGGPKKRMQKEQRRP